MNASGTMAHGTFTVTVNNVGGAPSGSAGSANSYVGGSMVMGYVPNGCTCGPWNSVLPPPPCPVHSQQTQIWNGVPAQNPYGAAKPYVNPAPSSTASGIQTIRGDKGVDMPFAEPEVTDDEAIDGLRRMLEELGE